MKWFKVLYENQPGKVDLYANSFRELAERLKQYDVLSIETVKEINPRMLEEGAILINLKSGRQYEYRVAHVSDSALYLNGVRRRCSKIVSFSELDDWWMYYW
ncbi:TPA: hypothetical protein ML375_002938 [Klebsiella variicola]|nr:hypothetical protein [Klebsiella variicola]